MNFLLRWPIFRGCVSFREGKFPAIHFPFEINFPEAPKPHIVAGAPPRQEQFVAFPVIHDDPRPLVLTKSSCKGH